MSIGSEVFGTMLYNSYFNTNSTADSPHQQQVFIEEIEPEIFKMILSFLYTDKIVLNPDNVMEVLYSGNYGFKS